jgi:nitric oxide reductase large subunit
MNIKEFLIGPLKSKKYCKYFNVINWIIVIILGILFIPMISFLIKSTKGLKEFNLDTSLGIAFISAILQVFLACALFVVRIVHGMCLKSLD